MMIKKIGIHTFGKYENDQLIVGFSKGLNVMYGKNEAGKSTLRHAMREMIFGFQTKKLEKHPYKPDSLNPIKISGEVIFGQDEAVGIQRSLSQVAEGQQIYSGHLVEIGNEPIREIADVPIMLYRGLFEMDLSDLVRLDTLKWDAVEDQISIQYGLENMLTPQSLLKKLEKEMHLLWRPHRRGKFAIKDIDEALQELGSGRRQILRNRKSFQERMQKKVKLEEELCNITDKIQSNQTWMNKIEEQLPTYRQYQELNKIKNELEKSGESSVKLEEFLFLQKEDEALRIEKSEIEIEIDKLKSSKFSMDILEQKLTQGSGNISDLQMKYDLYQRDYMLLQGVKEEKKQLQNHLEDKSKELTSDPWNEALLNYWRTLNIGELDRKIRWRKLIHTKSIVLNILTILGVVGAGLGYYMDLVNLMMAGVGVAGFAVLLMLMGSRNKIFEYNDIQFNNNVWINRIVFVSACESLKQKVEEYVIRQEDLERQKLSVKQTENDVTEILQNLSVQNQGNLDEIVRETLKIYKGAQSKFKTNGEIDLELSTLNTRKRKIGHALIVNQQSFNSMKNELRNLGDSVEDGIEVLKRLGLLKHRKNELLISIEKSPVLESGFHQNDDLENELKRLQTDNNLLKDKREQVRIELTNIEKDRERVYQDEKLEAIETDISKLEVDREAVVTQFNHLQMIHTLITYADENFRKKYQPGILNRASVLLKSFTGGRYNLLMVDANSNMLVKDTKKGEIISVHEQMSRGTLEQIYMSMRIAIAETVDRDGYKMPIILDEVFVNWDKDRMKNALHTLKDIGLERQIIYMTCHDWMANKLVDEYGANRIILSS